MAYFAQLDNSNIVIQVIAVNNDVIDNLPYPESNPIGIAFCQSLFGAETMWQQTSYNGNFCGTYAGIGFTYDPVNDIFVPPQPYASWLLNTTIYQWEAPVPYPDDGKMYYWDEATLSWVLVPDLPL